jgi:predicted metal-dependent hydrolase
LTFLRPQAATSSFRSDLSSRLRISPSAVRSCGIGISRGRKRKILTRVERHARDLGVTFTAAKIVDNRYRWGSCTVNDNVNFNWRFIKSPAFVIDYVIVHELSHLLEANHTPRFWTIIRAHTPSMEKAKAWLKEHGQVLEEEV